MQARLVGQPVPRKEGREKITGQASYIDDFSLPGMLYGTTVRSPVPRGRIRNTHFEGDLPWGEFTVVTAKDIPGKNYVALILEDQPFLAGDTVSHSEEAVLLLAHPDRHLLEEARRNVRLEIEPQPAVLSLEESLRRQEIIWGEDNVLKAIEVEKGDVDSVWNLAGFVVEGEYRTGAQEQLYIEPNGMVAVASPEKGVMVWGSMQCPYYVHKALMPLFGLPAEKVRVIQMETGGGFGGKEEYPSMIAGHAALLAWKSGKPVKIIYDRAEDLAATTKRHPSRTRHKTAVTREGKLLGMEIDFVLDGGAYATLSSVVLSRGTLHATGPYQCPNVRIRSQAVATNNPPYGAFRGFGAPQTTFALERHLNRVARTVGLTPEEFRRRNFLRTGGTTATGQVIRDKMDMSGLLEHAFELSGYPEKARRFAEEGGQRFRKGIGFASFMHGAGFTGSGEEHLASVAGLEASEDGRVRVLAASTEIGQGTNTILAQIAAETLGVDYDRVDVVQPDTGQVPDSGPTVASRTCMVVGKLVESAALGLRQTLLGSGLLQDGYSQEEFARACRDYIQKFGTLESLSRYQAPPDIHWDEERYRGDAYAAYAWAVYVAEVTVDSLTYETQVDEFWAVQDAGKIIHPVLAAGQIEGGVAQGIGQALYEKVVQENGRMQNSQLTNYIIPTSADAPPIRAVFHESPSEAGPSGAKGIGELPLDGTAAAVVNAIENATGCAIDTLPVLPETLMEAMETIVTNRA